MSFDAGAITSTMGIDMSPFARGMLQATSIASIFPQTVTNFLANPLLGIVGLAADAAGAVKGIFAGGFKGAVDMEQAEVSFKVMLGSAEKAQAALKGLSDFAAATPFELPELVTAGKKLLAFNVTADQLIPTLQKVGDVSSGIGAPIGEIAEIFGKAKVQGRLFMEDINQLTGRGIPIIQELAKQFNVSEDAVRGLVEKGKVGFPNLEQAFTSLTGSGGKFANLMQEQSNTLGGLWSTMKDTVAGAMRSIAGSVIKGLDLKAVLKNTIEGFSAFLEVVRPIGAAIMDGAVAAFGAMKPALSGLMPLLKGMADLVSSVLVPAFQMIKPVLEPVFKILGGIFELVGKILSGIGGVIRSASEALGLSAPRVARAADATPAAASATAAPPTVNVSVAGIDGSAATSQIAAKIQGPLRDGLARQRREIEGAARAGMMMRSL